MKRDIKMEISIPKEMETDFRLFTVLHGGAIESCSVVEEKVEDKLSREECRNKFKTSNTNVSELILFIPEKLDVVVFEEGSGSQLLPEDYLEGIDSYIMASVVNVDVSYGDLGIEDGDGEQYPFYYSTEEIENEFDLVFDWLKSYYGFVPNFTVLRE